MGTPTYTPLANLTLSSSAASVTFSSISQAYRDLVLVASATTTGADFYKIQINNDATAANYFNVTMEGNGSAAASTSYAGLVARIYSGLNYANVDTDQISNVTFHALDYSATDKHKSFLSRGNKANSGVAATAGRWANTAAITQIKFELSGVSFNAGSTFALYGISA